MNLQRLTATMATLGRNAVAGLLLAACMAEPVKSSGGESPDNIKLYRSRNQGAHWEAVGGGLPRSARINALLEVGGRVVAGTDSGAHLSDDEGTIWRPATGDAGPGTRVLALGQIPGRLFAGTDNRGVLQSVDLGETWQPSGPGVKGGAIRSLLGVGNVIYAGADHGGVWVSANGGETWKSQSNGLPEHSQVFDLAEHRGKVYAGLYSKGLYAWEAAEGRWERVAQVQPLEIASTGKTLLAGHNPGGIFFSDDSGTWMEGSRGKLSGVAVWSLAAADGFALAGVAFKDDLTLEQASLFTSRDEGRSWSQSDLGLPSGSSAVSFLIGRGYFLVGLHLGEAKEPWF